MSSETKTPEQYGLSKRPELELTFGNDFTPEIAEVIANPDMFELPNKPKLTDEKLKQIAKALDKQYAIALRHEKTRTEIRSKINGLLQTDNKTGDWISDVEDILEEAPQEVAVELMKNLRYLPEGIQEEVVRLALKKAPQEAVPELMRNLEYLPEAIQEKVARLALEKAPQEVSLRYLPEVIQQEVIRLAFKKNPQEAASGLLNNLRYLPKAIQQELICLAFEKAPQKAASELMKDLRYLPEAIQEEVIRLALEEAPQEANSGFPGLMWNLQYLPQAIREEVTRLALEKAPQKAAPGLMWNLEHLPERIREEVILLAFKKAPQEAASGLMRNLKYFPEEIREEMVHVAFKKAPQEAASGLSLKYFPEAIQEEMVRLAFKKAPQEAAPQLMWSLRYLPERIQEEVIRLAAEKAPQKADSALMRNLRFLPGALREKVVRLALEKAPQKVASELIWDCEYLFEATRNEIMEIVQTGERNNLTKSENINPILYKEIEDLEKQFSRKEFPKTGTRTVLLGGTLINNAILRIIPNSAFISWVKAYGAVEDWKEAGFNYVPIEPILKASSCKDGKDVRVYAGVLGISVPNYLTIYSSKEHHDRVKQQVETIKETLEKMGINHGHVHSNNFCVLHERTAEGEIDWSKPPRVYCIDFDQSTSSG